MKILVTGGAGFFGSHLVDALIEKNHDVAVIDNLSTGLKENLNPKASFYENDLLDFSKIEEIFEKEKPEIVCHLAAQIAIKKSIADPLFEANNNILASFNLIELSKKFGANKFIFASSGGTVYGDTEIHPTPEDHPEWPISPYGVTKLAVDKYLNCYGEIYGFNFTSLRLGNVYGPRQNPHGEAGVISIFLEKMIRGENPTINGDGKQTRDYVYVEDAVEAMLLALENIGKSGIYNVGTGKETNVIDIFRQINGYFENKFKESFGPAKIGEQKTGCLSFDKIKKDFGWEPKVSFEEGMKKTCQWFINKKS